MRTLLSSSDPRAAEAIDLFAFEAAKAVCAMALTLEGLDCLVFTGGIGEHAAKVRALICNRLRWLGLEVDPKANDRGADLVSSGSSSVEIRVIATSEETTIARHVLAMVHVHLNSPLASKLDSVLYACRKSSPSELTRSWRLEGFAVEYALILRDAVQ